MLSAAALLLLVIVSCTPTDTSHLPIVDLGYELHQATFNQSGQYYNFSNVRYAAPPLGSLRSAAPQKPSKPATKPLNDGSNAVTCIQVLPQWYTLQAAWLTNGTAGLDISAGYTPPNITSLPPQSPQATEDCLFLDVMVPQAVFKAPRKNSGAPVMVWIHGGGYTLGSKTLYSPSAAGLIKASQYQGGDGVIWVAMNYRLGLFGFLSGPTFQANGTANAGLHDQRLALEWVQQHIHKFGGDPSRVAVIGESAGGGSTLHQVTAYGGLKGKVPFQQAIIQSPGYQPSPSVTLQENIYNSFLSRAGVNNLQEARGLSTETLQLVNYQMVGESFPYGTFTFNPVVDGSFAPELPGALLLHGGFDTTLKIMAGHNLLEGLEFMDPFAQNETVYEKDLRIYFPTITDGAIQYITQTLYPPVFDGSQPYTDYTGRGELMITEAFFTCNTYWLANAYGRNVYNYEFTVPPSLHGEDIVYTYYNGPNPGVVNDTLAVSMQRYFTNFVQTGNPNGPGLPNFPIYGPNAAVQNFNSSFIGQLTDNSANGRCLWWQKGLFA